MVVELAEEAKHFFLDKINFQHYCFLKIVGGGGTNILPKLGSVGLLITLLSSADFKQKGILIFLCVLVEILFCLDFGIKIVIN